MAETKHLIIQKAFDPATTTLQEVIDMYVEENKKAGKFQGKSGAKGFTSNFNHPDVKKYLTEPVTVFIESATDIGPGGVAVNPLTLIFDKLESDETKRKFRSAFKGIEDNVESQLKRLGKLGQYADFGGMPRLTATVINPAKGAARSTRFGFDYKKAGELVVGLLEYAEKNPKDVPVVRALLAQLNMGLRPGEIQDMPISALREAIDADSMPGIYLAPAATKMKSPMNLPTSPVTLGIFEAAKTASQEIATAGGANEIPDLMFLGSNGKRIPDGAMTRVLKQIKVPGIMFDFETGQDLDYMTSAYDLRRFNATIGDARGLTLRQQAGMHGRPVREANTGSAVIYPSHKPGRYAPEMMEPHYIVHGEIADQVAKALGLSAGTLFDPTQDIVTQYISAVNDNPGRTPAQVMDMFGIKAGEASPFQKVSTLTGISLQPPEPVDPVDAPAAAPAAADAPRLSLKQLAKATSKALQRKDVQAVGGGSMAGAAILFGDPEETIASTTTEMTVEAGTRTAARTVLPKVGAAAATGPLSPAAIAAMVAAESVVASPSAGVGELNLEERMQLDLARQQGNIGVEKELMARTPITEIGGSDARTMAGQRVTREDSTDEVTFQSILEDRRRSKLAEFEGSLGTMVP